MHNYDINTFWLKRLPPVRQKQANLIRGWSIGLKGLPAFLEAPLSSSNNFGSEDDPNEAPVLLVSAPGAVGKTTLARQVASKTNSIYIDLSVADPVGGNTLSGGLAKSNSFADWKSENVTALIDGLDEARLRVTQEAFEAFLHDVAEMSVERNVPTVLFGRTGAIQETWLVLSDKLRVAVLEIGYYNFENAVKFACARLEAANQQNPHFLTCRHAVELLLKRLRHDTGQDGDRFSGYAPVLQAVADRVGKDKNPNALIAKIEKGEQSVTLETVVNAILDREHQKISSLPFEDDSLSKRLYTLSEQIERLVARVYKQHEPEVAPQIRTVA